VVWGKKPIIAAIPSILLLIGTGCGYTLTYYSAQAYYVRLHLPLSVKVVPQAWIEAGIWSERMRTIFFSMSLATNVIVTVLIAARISWLNQGLREALGGRNSKPYHRIILLIIESGVVNAACLLLGLIMNGPLKTHLIQGESGSEFQVATFVVFPSTIANIFPTLLILLVALGKTTEPSSTGSRSGTHNFNSTRVTVPTLTFAHSEPYTTADDNLEFGLHLRTLGSGGDVEHSPPGKVDLSSSLRNDAGLEHVSLHGQDISVL